MKTIKSTIYLLLSGCVALLSACSQSDDTPEILPLETGRQIVFSSSLPDVESRAASIATDLSYFYLSAFDQDDERLIANSTLKEYFSNKKLANSGSDKFSSEECLWPEPGREDDRLHFFAYCYPYLSEGASVTNSSTITGTTPTFSYSIKDLAIPADIAGQTDFVTAYATGTYTGNIFSGVSLKFRHQFSRIEVKAKGTHQSCNIEVAGVSFGEAPMKGSFTFQTTGDSDGKWADGIEKGDATYIFRQGDKVVTIGAEPVSIMGAKINDGSYDNCAMFIPAKLSPWDFANYPDNNAHGLYINVLLRILDKTPSGNNKQQYPYFDNSQGLNALNIPIILLGVDSDGKVTDNYGTLYKKDGKYFSDSEKKNEFTVPAGKTVKEFGWAAVPVSADWEAGKIYTYTLDYTLGVGVHGPNTKGNVAPKAGDPIINDKVGVGLEFKNWTSTTPSGVTVPGN